ncbi:STAS domain-containing protein [Adhaeribacter rhizoryzae]|uniref:Anti-sigma factor antagonist n=1 Tax=Adhaeribacter rhizoryzae TaxID=2607907 RepID=A0A5M6DLG6_9BACT|nr:STAS domain-containing protein [Adhaeribacter rhizoryzae]KAA5548293.1 STAS domain-containing protein [Adhaeribacter rhizoryzae]
MYVNSERTPDSFVISIEGDIDATTSILVDNEISKIYDLPLKNLWIDCCQVKYISSAGVGVFISHLQKLKKHKINMTLYGLKPKLKSIFKVLGLEHYLSLQPEFKDLADQTVEDLD